MANATIGLTPSRGRLGLATLLRPFARVRPAEAITASLMSLTVFLLLTAYYLLKTAREPLVLLHGGAEVKQYAAAGQALLMVVVVRAYTSLARRVGRQKLLATVYLFFIANLAVFVVLARAHVAIGVPFFLWVGVFNMTAVSQFWSLAADIYSAEQGKRLFAVLGLGSSLGAVVGAEVAKRLAWLGPAGLMMVAGGILLACVSLLLRIAGRGAPAGTSRNDSEREDPIADGNVVRALLRDRYVLLIAVLTLVLNWVRSNGDYLVDRTLLAALAAGKAQGADASVFITTFKANYFVWVNVTGVVLQAFAVSRVLARTGVRGALLVLPAVAFVEYGAFLAAPVLSVLLVAKVGESALEYSLQSTARQALFLEASRLEKYVGKTIVDTVIVRAGDALTAVVVLAASKAGLSSKAFASLNLVLVVVWIASVFAIGRENARRAGVRSTHV